jgi:hypothetical protein
MVSKIYVHGVSQKASMTNANMEVGQSRLVPKNLRQVGKQNTSDCFVCLKLSLLWLWFLIVGSIDRFSRGTAGRTVLENVADAKITAVVSSHCRVLVSFLYAQGLTGNNGRFDG